MNNLFGIGILLEIKDHISERITRVAKSMEDVQTEAEKTVNSVNNMSDSINNNSSSFNNFSDSASNLGSSFNHTSSYARKMERQMQRLSMILGGEVPESTKQAYAEMFNLRHEIKRTQRAYGKWSIEAMNARNKLNEWALGLDDATFKQVFMQSQLGLSNWQLQQQANSIKLNARMVKLMGSQTEILTRRMKGLQKHGVTPEMMMPRSTIGQFQLMNETIQASGSPIYALNSGYRALGHRAEKVIKNFSAQKVAMRMANGDMVRYGLLLRGAQAGLMNLGIAFPMVGMAAGLMYASIFKVAFSTDEKLQALAETVKGKLLKAFEPMLNIVRSLATAFLKFVGKVADLIIKFNEAHPLCAKIIQGFALLLPALTLLLLPISMLGLGFKSLGVAINALWTLIRPFVVGIGGASAMALSLVVVLGTLTLVFANLWKSNEKFRNAIINTANTIKSLVIGAFEKFKTIIQDLGEAFDKGGVVGVIKKLDSMFKDLVTTATEKLPQFIEKGAEIVVNILEGIATNLPQVYAKGRELLQSVLQGIVDVLPQLIESGVKVLEVWLNAMVSNISLVLNMGLEIAMALIEGFLSVLPQLVETGVIILTTLGQIITNNLPMIMDAGIQILNTLIEAIINNIPLLVTTATDILNNLVTFISENLPILINAGIEILMALTNAIIENLPLIIDCGTQIINTIITAIVNNLPLLINAGIQLIGSLITAILNNLPQLLSAGVQLVLAIVNGIVNSLPQILSAGGRIVSSLFTAVMRGVGQLLSAGIQLVLAVGKGIISGVGSVISNMGQALSQVVTSAKTFIPRFLSIGGDLIKGLAQGIANSAGAVIKSITGVVQGAIKGAKKLLGIKSPSRVFKRIGAWTSEGMAIGVEKEKPQVVRNVGSLATDTIDEAEKHLKGISFDVNTSNLDNTLNLRSLGESGIVNNNTTAKTIHNITDTITNHYSTLQNINNTSNILGDTITNTYTILEDTISNISNTLGDNITTMSTIGDTINNSTSNTLQNITNSISNTLGDNINNTSNILGDTITNMSKIGDTLNSSNVLGDTISNSNVVNDLVTNNTRNISTILGDTISNVSSKIGDTITKVSKVVNDLITNNITNTSSILGDTISNSYNLAKDIINNSSNIANEFINDNSNSTVLGDTYTIDNSTSNMDKIDTSLIVENIVPKPKNPPESSTKETKKEEVNYSPVYNYNITVETSDNDNDPVSMARKIFEEVKRLQQIEDAMNYDPNPLSIF